MEQMFDYHYYAGAEGRRYCYSSTATVRCPFDEGPPGWLQSVLDESEDAEVRTVDIALVWKNAHRSRSHSPYEDGKCRACGAKLRKVGYATWIEEPWPDEETVEKEARERARESGENEEQAVSSARSTRAINERLGMTHRRRPGSYRHFGLKREAITWAREEAEADKRYFREEQAAKV